MSSFSCLSTQTHPILTPSDYPTTNLQQQQPIRARVESSKNTQLSEMDKVWFTANKGPLTDNDPRSKPKTGSRMPDSSAQNQARKGGFERRPTTMRAAQNQSVALPGPTSRNEYAPSPQNFVPSNPTLDSVWDPQRPTIQYSTHTRKLRKDQFVRGMIINAPVLNEDSNPCKSAGTVNASISAYCNVYGKPRYLVVTHLYTTHYQVMPIYTHGDTGLKGKEAYAHEYVSLRDGRIQKAGFKALSDYSPLVTEGSGNTTFNRLSVVHFVHPVSRKYDLKISVHGNLLPESATRMATYIDQASKKGLGL